MPQIAILPGDGIGPEVTAAARSVLAALDLDLMFVEAPVGGTAYREQGDPLPTTTLDLARTSDAVLFGAVGDPRYDALEDRRLRPEAAILGLRKELGLFANLRPAKLFAGLEDASALKREIAAEIDMVIVRELTGDIYFGEKKRGERGGVPCASDLMIYDVNEVTRIAHVAFQTARKRRGKLTSVDKANVLETSRLWRETVIAVSAHYPDVTLDHLYVDNAAMQLVRAPGQFDVIVTGNLFGDILSDQASMCAGSIGMLPSAAMGEGPFGMYEPIHGSAPDIAGQGKANPCAAILSAAMLLRHSLGEEAAASGIEAAVAAAIAGGARTADLGGTLSTQAMTDAVLARL